MHRASLVLSMLAGVARPLATLSSSRPSANQDLTDQDFVGSWRLTVVEANGSSSQALATLGADGTMVTAEHPVVTPPVADGPVLTSSGHGAWRSTGPGTAVSTFVGLGCDGSGAFFGTVTIRSKVTLDAGAETFGGEFTATIADPTGKTMAVIPGTIQATRIVAEAPARS
jgi:hypothetical protein